MQLWMFISLTLIVFAAAVGYGLLLAHNLKLQKSIRDLEQQMSVFADTSINVERCVDRLALGEQNNTAVGPTASRRWLLSEANQRLNQGESVSTVAQTLALSRAETQLIAATR